jgi:hypothetical protein
MALEIVKPSEQSFKSLLTPSQRGGVILLLTQAIGKQEQDNLNFLSDHHLLPERAIKLTNNPDQDVKIINWCLNEGVFEKMAKVACLPAGRGEENFREGNELATNGVQQFWKKVDDLLNMRLQLS